MNTVNSRWLGLETQLAQLRKDLELLKNSKERISAYPDLEKKIDSLLSTITRKSESPPMGRVLLANRYTGPLVFVLNGQESDRNRW